jgi:hypothetical protein
LLLSIEAREGESRETEKRKRVERETREIDTQLRARGKELRSMQIMCRQAVSTTLVKLESSESPPDSWSFGSPPVRRTTRLPDPLSEVSLIVSALAQPSRSTLLDSSSARRGVGASLEEDHNNSSSRRTSILRAPQAHRLYGDDVADDHLRTGAAAAAAPPPPPPGELGEPSVGQKRSRTEEEQESFERLLLWSTQEWVDPERSHAAAWLPVAEAAAARRRADLAMKTRMMAEAATAAAMEQQQQQHGGGGGSSGGVAAYSGSSSIQHNTSAFDSASGKQQREFSPSEEGS